MNEITFTLITPIFNFELQPPTSEFSHSGILGDAKYSVSLKRVHQCQPDYDRLLNYAEQSPDTLGRLVTCASNGSVTRLTSVFLSGHYHMTDYYLIVDTTQPMTKERNLFVCGSPETLSIAQAVLDALRLHSSKGLLWYQTYWFRSPPHPAYPGAQSAISPPTSPLSISHLGQGKSTLSDSEFGSCRSTVNSLLNRKNANSSFDLVLRLALAYHRILFNLEAVDHALLILMVVFEALFKSKEENSPEAVARISMLLSDTKKTAKHIREKFIHGDDSFTKLRDQIAHGDSTLDLLKVSVRYPELYGHVTKAMIRLIAIPDGILDVTRDYYDEINGYIRARFNTLPDS